MSIRVKWAKNTKAAPATVLFRGLKVNRLSLNPFNNKAGVTCSNTPDTTTCLRVKLIVMNLPTFPGLVK